MRPRNNAVLDAICNTVQGRRIGIGMENGGWQQLFCDWSWARGEGRFPIAAYSEFMPPPRIGQKPYGCRELDTPFSADDPWGWRLSAEEQAQELAPGLELIARQLIETTVGLASGKGAHHIGHHHLTNNPYWPAMLAAGAAALPDEPHLFLSPLALAKTQDDKGHVRWTLFGGSQYGPAQGFWKSFFTAPSMELPAQKALDCIRDILRLAYGVPPSQLEDLRSAGLRVLPMGQWQDLNWTEGPLPSWTKPFLFDSNEPLDHVRYVLTFRPFAFLSEPLQQAYLAGQIRLLPFPGSLVFWGSPLYRRLAGELPLADQMLLLQAIARHERKVGIRVPQSGWLHCAHANSAEHDAGLGKLHEGFRRSHRWQRVPRNEDATALAREDHIYTVLFSTHPDAVGLYGKPMARNAQIWSSEFRGVLHGPTADGGMVRQAIAALEQGGSFGYRFFYPPMQSGGYAVFWHHPLIAFRDKSGQSHLIDSPLKGFFSAMDPARRSGAEIELWPRFEVPVPHGTEQIGEIFQRVLGLPSDPVPDPSTALTFHRTANRTFEIRYWKTIANLAEGRYLNKNTGDCVRDPVTQKRLTYPERDLEILGDYLLNYYRRTANDCGLGNQVEIGDMPFRWETDFEFPWMGGWLDNRQGRKLERNIVVMIPGRKRDEAMIMADHYDTAYMEDVYGYRAEAISDGSRLAASGADDNHSATASLMLAAPILMELSRAGRLGCDVWLVHLTGEEFPSDCLGARHLAQQLVQGTFGIRVQDRHRDMRKTKVRGAYVLDMIAHNNDRQRDIFQIAPGTSRESLWLAYEANRAARIWEAGTATWNEKPLRRKAGGGRRSPHGGAIPLIARHSAPKPDVRLHDNPKSTLFNTDGQIFSDAGIPTALFMENYDINRTGYHDTRDTMANIDLDYGAAIAAIAIEAVARAAAKDISS
jgi:peptidase M28-like protein